VLKKKQLRTLVKSDKSDFFSVSCSRRQRHECRLSSNPTTTKMTEDFKGRTEGTQRFLEMEDYRGEQRNMECLAGSRQHYVFLSPDSS
jgi:hypothetical protein